MVFHFTHKSFKFHVMFVSLQEMECSLVQVLEHAQRLLLFLLLSNQVPTLQFPAQEFLAYKLKDQ